MAQPEIEREFAMAESKYWLAFENAFLTYTRDEFQAWVGRILKLAYPRDFYSPRQGTTKGGGDLGCDFFQLGTDTVYAVYAPREFELSQFNAKLKSDFSKARDNFQDLKEWCFVHNERELSATTYCLIRELGKERTQNRKTKIRVFGKDQLWNIVRNLSENNLQKLFPGIRDDDRVQVAVEIIRDLWKDVIRLPSVQTASPGSAVIHPAQESQAVVESRSSEAKPEFTRSKATETPPASAEIQSTEKIDIVQPIDVAQSGIEPTREQTKRSSPPSIMGQGSHHPTTNRSEVSVPIPASPPKFTSPEKLPVGLPKTIRKQPDKRQPRLGTTPKKESRKLVQSRYVLMISASVLLISIAGFWYQTAARDLITSVPNRRTVVGLVGQVRRPGVYDVGPTSLTCMQLVEKIGGLHEDASGQFQVIRNGRPGGLFSRAEADKFQLRSGDLVVAGSGNIIKADGNAAREYVQIGFVDLVDRPVVIKLKIEQASLETILRLLNQDSSLAVRVRVVLPPSQPFQEQLHPSMPLPSESVIIFPPNSIATDRLPTDLPPPIQLPGPSIAVSRLAVDQMSHRHGTAPELAGLVR